jgi:hypothetical protein
MSDFKTKWQEYKEKNGVTPLDMLNPNAQYASEEKSKSRFDICKSCPELIKLTTQCKKCGCIMKLKTKLEAATCPLEKW